MRSSRTDPLLPGLSVEVNYTDVWKCGGGTQSIAIGALIMQGLLPKPDYAVCANTGRERKKTWEYMDAILQPALDKVGVTIHRPTALEFGYYGEAIVGGPKQNLFIPAFTKRPGEEVGKISNFCNGKWKQDVVNNWLRRTHGVNPENVRSWIGFSVDEMPRVLKMRRGQEYREGRILLPLVDRGIKRAEAIRIVEEMGWPTPPRSACWMCPNQTDAEWLDLTPEEFAMACEFEKEMQRTKDPYFWLHDSCVPLAQVEFKRPHDPFMRACNADEGAGCFT